MVGLDPCGERLKESAQPELGQLQGPTTACQDPGGWRRWSQRRDKVQVERREAEADLMKTCFPMRRRRPVASGSHSERFSGFLWVK